MRLTRDELKQRARMARIDLIDEIALAGQRIGEARTWVGDLVYPTDAQTRLLRAVERSHYCLAIADVGRALKVTRQAAHRVAYEAAAKGRLELLPNPDDARILQLFLTPAGREYLASLRRGESEWLIGLLNGLSHDHMRTTTHVVRVIRQRLERDARELEQRKKLERGAAGRGVVDFLAELDAADAGSAGPGP